MCRESNGSIWPRNNTFDDLHPYEYVFADGKRDFFVTQKSDSIVRPILDVIPLTAIDSLIRRCQPFTGNASKNALREFFRRNIFAHLLIGENFALHLDSRNSGGNTSDPTNREELLSHDGYSDVWASPTRYVLHDSPLEDVHARGFEGGRTLRAILPYGVESVLRHVAQENVQDTLIDGILQVRELDEYKTVRKLLYELRSRQSTGAEKGLVTIASEINKKTNSQGTFQVIMTFPLGSDPVLPKAAFDVLRPVPRWIGARLPRQLRARWAGRYLALAGRKDEVRQDTLQHLKRIFPNTFS